MKVVILFNPISGAGQAAEAGKAAAEALQRRHHEVALTPMRLQPPHEWLDDCLHQADALVVVGGDGAVRMAAASAARTQTPLYHLPHGTENLFAREFGMDRSTDTLLKALERHEVRRVDLGQANQRTFLLMASVGFDADVVHELARRRRGAITHLSYLRPILARIWRWRPAPLQISVDGKRIDQGQSGFVVVGNCRQYGWRLDPAGHASMDDGLLDVVFFPARSRLELIAWAIRCRRRRHLDHRRLIYERGRCVSITCDTPQRYQLDGDPPGLPDPLLPALEHDCGNGAAAAATAPDRSVNELASNPAPFQLHIEVRPAALPVLTP